MGSVARIMSRRTSRFSVRFLANIHGVRLLHGEAARADVRGDAATRPIVHRIKPTHLTKWGVV